MKNLVLNIVNANQPQPWQQPIVEGGSINI